MPAGPVVRRKALAVATGLLCAGFAAPGPVSGMQWRQRIVLASSPDPHDARLALQRQALERWRAGAADRDLVLVEIAGERVIGASDKAVALRRAFDLKPDAFQAILIGKDGTVAMRSADPLTGPALQGVIDAMPMRRAGQR